jgi:hypothetical protein
MARLRVDEPAYSSKLNGLENLLNTATALPFARFKIRWFIDIWDHQTYNVQPFDLTLTSIHQTRGKEKRHHVCHPDVGHGRRSTKALKT